MISATFHVKHGIIETVQKQRKIVWWWFSAPKTQNQSPLNWCSGPKRFLLLDTEIFEAGVCRGKMLQKLGQVMSGLLHHLSDCTSS